MSTEARRTRGFEAVVKYWLAPASITSGDKRTRNVTQSQEPVCLSILARSSGQINVEIVADKCYLNLSFVQKKNTIKSHCNPNYFLIEKKTLAASRSTVPVLFQRVFFCDMMLWFSVYI